MFDNQEWQILIVDDNPINRDLLARVLENEGYQCTSASDGSVALDLLHSQPFDVMVLDIMMPIIDGYQVLEHIHADDNLRHLPVIVISALDDIAGVVRCIKLGAQDYLFKPFNNTMFKARIRATLERKYYYDQLQIEREKSDQLLLNILPEPIAARLKQGEEHIADAHADVSVLFADLVNFTPLSASIPPEDLIQTLNEIFSEFDQLCNAYQLEKIKTVGDSYLVAGNLIYDNEIHPQAIGEMALEMMATMEYINAKFGYELALRIGIHCGPVVAGVIGKQKFFYDLWGATVNLASRLEAYSETNCIHVSHVFFTRTQDFFNYQARGELEMKGLDATSTYFLQSKK